VKLNQQAVLDAIPYAASILKVRKERGQTNASSVWRPNPGAQVMVRDSLADWVYMGGQAGGGKTMLTLGLGATEHTHTVIFRREFEDLKGAEGLIEKSRIMLAPFGSYNANDHMWRVTIGGVARTIEMAGCQHEEDKLAQQGKARDLFAFDEAPQFTRGQVRFIAGWNRSADPKQRCRIILTGNPPTTVEGQWIVEMFAPWLDPTHPNPAQPGELRWFVTIGERDVEVDGPEPREIAGEVRTPQSRTFIPSKLSENPTYANGKYAIVLDNLPEPLRSQLKKGDFTIGLKSDAFQVIPTEWIRAAQKRWTEKVPDIPLTTLGVDIAHGGDDRTVLVGRRKVYVEMPEEIPGVKTPTGHAAAAKVAARLTRGGFANIDAIGVGASAYDVARERKLPVFAVNVGARCEERDRSGKLTFANVRAWGMWRLREALDPEADDPVALPPHPELLPDLAAPRFSIGVSGIKVEPKPGIAKRLGRSPDVGDAVMLAFLPPPARTIVLPPSLPLGTYFQRTGVRGI